MRPRARPSDPAPEDRRGAVNERRARAVEEPLDVRLVALDPYPVLEVRNPLHGTSYSVLLPAYPSLEAGLCGCTDFARRGLGTCKHLEATRRSVTERPPTDRSAGPSRRPVRPESFWKEVDRRLARLDREEGPESLRWRRPGSALFEPRRERSRGKEEEAEEVGPDPVTPT